MTWDKCSKVVWAKHVWNLLIQNKKEDVLKRSAPTSYLPDDDKFDDSEDQPKIN